MEDADWSDQGGKTSISHMYNSLEESRMIVSYVAPRGTKVVTRSEHRPFQGMKYMLRIESDMTLLMECDSEYELIRYVERKGYEL
jgi:hypothetical protein